MNEEAQTDPYALLLALDAKARDNQLVSDAADAVIFDFILKVS